MYSQPDFLVIGPQKTGTSWLYKQLRQVPGVAMPPLKELFFFYDADVKLRRSLYEDIAAMQKDYPSIQVGTAFQDQVLARLENRIKIQRRRVRQDVLKLIKRGQWLWAFKYLMLPRSFSASGLKYYASLFQKAEKQITGDISPAYFELGKHAIEKIKKNFPDIKIIMILREPVKRDWSQIRMTYFKDKQSPAFQLDDFIQKPNISGDYERAILNWEAFFPANQILYLFYDDLVAKPQYFLDSLLSFIGADKRGVKLVKEMVEAGVKKEMDADTKAALQAKNLTQYKFLAAKFGASSYPSQWLKQIPEGVMRGSANTAD